MPSTIHLNKWMHYIFQLQFVVQSHKDQDGTWTFIVSNQPQEISSLKSVTNQGRDVIGGI